MSSARDHDDWKRARFGSRRRDDDPNPAPGGLVESVYCALHARTGEWPADFLELARRLWKGQIPRRFHTRSAAIRAGLERARALELEAPPRPPPSVLVYLGAELVEVYSPAVSGPEGGGGGELSGR